MIDRIVSVVVALSLACLVWLYTRTRDQEILDNIPIPVHVQLPASQSNLYHLEVTGPSQVPVSFTGPPSCIRELRALLQQGEVRIDWTLQVPEDRQNEARFSDTIHINATDVHVPPGVTPMIVEGRNRLPVTLHKLIERRLPVRFDHSLEERTGKITVEPSTVVVRGPQEVLERTRAISTQPYILPQMSDTVPTQEEVIEGTVPLVADLDGRPIQTRPVRVTVRLAVQARQKQYEIADLPIHFLCPPNFALRPKFIGDGRAGKITIRVRGPIAEETPSVQAFVDLTRGKFQPGLHEEPLRLQLPPDYEMAQTAPRSIAFELQPTDVPTRILGVLKGTRQIPLDQTGFTPPDPALKPTTLPPND